MWTQIIMMQPSSGYQTAQLLNSEHSELVSHSQNRTEVDTGHWTQDLQDESDRQMDISMSWSTFWEPMKPARLAEGKQHLFWNFIITLCFSYSLQMQKQTICSFNTNRITEYIYRDWLEWNFTIWQNWVGNLQFWIFVNWGGWWINLVVKERTMRFYSINQYQTTTARWIYKWSWLMLLTKYKHLMKLSHAWQMLNKMQDKKCCFFRTPCGQTWVFLRPWRW